MHISNNLPSPLNIERRLPATPQQPAAQPADNNGGQAKVAERNIVLPYQGTDRPRFVMPDNATSHRGQIALREYQFIQNEGGPELLNRVDVRV